MSAMSKFKVLLVTAVIGTGAVFGPGAAATIAGGAAVPASENRPTTPHVPHAPLPDCLLCGLGDRLWG